MAWCLMAPSHYLNQCWLIASEACGILLRAMSQEIAATSPWAQCVNSLMLRDSYIRRVTHICVEWHIWVCDLTIIGSDNGLLPGRCQAMIWTNAEILLIGPLGTNFNEILFETRKFSCKKIKLKMSSAKWQPSCVSLTGLTASLVCWWCMM